MKTLIIKDRTIYLALAALLLLLIAYNLLAMMSTNKLLGLLPISIQAFLLYVLISRQIYAQRLIRVYALIFFIGAQTLRISGILMQVWARYAKGEDWVGLFTADKTIMGFIFLCVGVIMLVLNKHFGETAEI